MNFMHIYVTEAENIIIILMTDFGELTTSILAGRTSSLVSLTIVVASKGYTVRPSIASSTQTKDLFIHIF